jgi:DNA-binding transcriptional LysR family regulator
MVGGERPLTEGTAYSGHLRVGVTYRVAGYFLPRHYARFLRNYPRITVELRELPREAIEQGLVDGTSTSLSCWCQISPTRRASRPRR